jgi:hypothetical protein
VLFEHEADRWIADIVLIREDSCGFVAKEIKSVPSAPPQADFNNGVAGPWLNILRR